MKFTKDTVATLAPPPGKLDHIEWDPELPGFGLRFRQARRSWVVQFRINRQQRRESLGDVRKVGLEAARKIARQRFAQVELGIDPKTTKVTANAAVAATKMTLAVATERYLDFKRPKLRPASYEAARRYLTKHWEPLSARPLASIGRADVAARLQELTKEHGRVSSSRARATLAALFTWAAREGLVEVNPVVNTNDPAAGITSRERVLDESEIKTIWDACGDDDFSVIVKVLLLCGARRCEIAHLRWDEISFTEGLIKLPGERVKNRRPHEVPMSGAVSSILKARPRYRNADGSACDLVFGGGKRFTSWSNSKLALDRKIAETGKVLAPWSLHDLRRSAASGMQQLGVRVEVIERALNHVSGSYKGVAGIYQRDPMHEETRDALERWATRVRTIVKGLKIVPKHRA